MEPLGAFAVLVDVRLGRVLRAEPNEGARKPAFKLWIDFGPLGVRSSRARLSRFAPRKRSSGGWW